MTEQTHEYAFVTTLSAVARIRATSEDEARNLLTEIECLDLTGVTICDGVVVTEASLCEETASAELFEIDGKEIDDTDPDDGQPDEAQEWHDFDADGWLEPTSPLAEMLTARGFTLVQTGGGCKAWVRIMPDGEHIVVTNTNNGDEPTETNWIIGRYVNKEWECAPGKGYSVSTMDGESLEFFKKTLSNVEAVNVAEGQY